MSISNLSFNFNFGELCRMWHEEYKMKTIGKLSLENLLSKFVWNLDIHPRVLLDRSEQIRDDVLFACIEAGYITKITKTNRYGTLTGYRLTVSAHRQFVEGQSGKQFVLGEENYKTVSIEQVEAEIAAYYASRAEIGEYYASVKNLLLISSSKTKRQDAELMPAIRRNDGPVYRCLRKLLRDDLYPVDEIGCLIISAKYGLITTQDDVEYYDQKMTPSRAKELREQIQSKLSCFLNSDLQDVFINLGKDYMPALEGFHWGGHRTLAASGRIGQKISQMRYWIMQIGYEERMNRLVR